MSESSSQAEVYLPIETIEDREMMISILNRYDDDFVQPERVEGQAFPKTGKKSKD
jgi:hypothetical protein